MTAKEKAENIFNRYKKICDEELKNSGNIQLAKEYSLIAVEFAREFITGDLSERFDKTMYLFEVKQEIEKL